MESVVKAVVVVVMILNLDGNRQKNYASEFRNDTHAFR
jgi:hypothetical protein